MSRLSPSLHDLESIQGVLPSQISIVFKRGKLWRRGRIYSDEVFSVHIGGRDSIAYFEGNRKMTIAVNEGNAVCEETISRWDDDPMRAISDEEQARIADNIRRAFESQDLKVSFPDSPRQVNK